MLHFGKPSAEIPLTVPADYKHAVYIDLFRENEVVGGKDTIYINPAFRSLTFEQTSTRLIPRKTYKGTIIPVLGEPTIRECVEFLQKRKSLLVGAHGVALFHQFQKDQFPRNKWVTCLTPDLGARILRGEGDGWEFDLVDAANLDADYCLLSITE